MKKTIVVLCLMALLLVTSGCGKNQIVCSKTVTEDGQKMSVDVTLDLDNDEKVTNASLTYDFGDKESAEQYCSIFKIALDESNKDKIVCSGSKVTIKDMDAFDEDETEDSEKMVGQTKKEVIETATKEGYTCK